MEKTARLFGWPMIVPLWCVATIIPPLQLALAEVKDAVAEQLRLEYAQSLIEADKTQALAQLVSGASVPAVWLAR